MKDVNFLKIFKVFNQNNNRLKHVVCIKHEIGQQVNIYQVVYNLNIVLAKELSGSTGRIYIILDEITTGLHSLSNTGN